MARRSDHSRTELKGLVLETATRIIAEQGLSALTARKIASEIGYSPGSIYNVVEDLDELIGLVNEGTMRKLNTDLAAIDMTGNALADAGQVLDVYIKFRNEHSGLWEANLNHAVRQDVQQPAGYVEQTEVSFKIAARAIGPAFNGDIAKTQLAVRVLWASLQGIFSVSDSATVFQDGVDSQRQMADNLVETYLKGVSAG
ncbi:MAG: TetR/AcrR family transcriptional regulator [Marinosulfonomonas sp.]